jgi:formate dehydrogenase maturation protein FdhE
VTQSISSQTLNRLEEWVKEKTHSSRFFDFYRSLLQIQAEIEDCLKISNPELSNKTISKRIAKGKPILNFEDLSDNWPLIRDTFSRVTAVFAYYADLFGDIPKVLLKKEPQKILTKKIARSWFEGENLPTSLAGEDIDPALLDLLIHQSLRPFLIKHSQVRISLVKQDKWQRGYCPVCGGKPDISCLEKEVGALWLVCSRCDAKWRFRRLMCPNCGNQDANSTTFFIDDDEIYRLYLCDKCHTYLKTVDLRKVKTQVFLPLERLLTLDIDRQGQEKGYRPGYIQTNNVV